MCIFRSKIRGINSRTVSKQVRIIMARIQYPDKTLFFFVSASVIAAVILISIIVTVVITFSGTYYSSVNLSFQLEIDKL